MKSSENEDEDAELFPSKIGIQLEWDSDSNGIGICGPFCRLTAASDRNQQNKYPDKDFAGASKIGKFFSDSSRPKSLILASRAAL